MKDFIVKTYESITALLFLAIVGLSGVIGASFSGYGRANGMYILGGIVVGFFIAVIVTGLIYTFLSINSHLQDISNSLRASPVSTNDKEPSING